MANVTVTILMILFVFLIPILIGVYVYRDARRRQMNAPLWTLVAILAPSLVGFIIYLLVRGSYSDLKCPLCGSQVREQYLVCPQCGAKLKGKCSNCGSAVEPEWKVCPHCASPVLRQVDVEPPVRRKDRALWKILILVLAVPILFLALILVFRFGGSSGSTNMGRITLSDYIYEKNNDELTAWINAQEKDALNRSDQVYALQYQTQLGDGKATYYLIYIPSATEVTEFDFDRTGFGDSVVELSFSDGGADAVDAEPVVFTLAVHGDVWSSLKIFVEGERMELNLFDAEANPCLFDIVAEETSRSGNTTVNTHSLTEIVTEEIEVPEEVGP